MASYNGSDGGDGDDFMRPPDEPHLRLPRPPSELTPDTEDNVAQQTEDIFKNFVYQRYRRDNIQQDYENTPVAPEIINLTQTPLSPSAEIGRQLARIGDDINERYADQFNDMIGRLNIDQDSAYEAFAGVARKLFENEINWGRVLTLLCFGYRIALRVLKDQVSKFGSFLKRIVGFIVQFLIKEKIARWIAEHGGWRAALTYTPSTSAGWMALVASLAVLSVATVYYIHSRS